MKKIVLICTFAFDHSTVGRKAKGFILGKEYEIIKIGKDSCIADEDGDKFKAEFKKDKDGNYLNGELLHTASRFKIKFIN